MTSDARPDEYEALLPCPHCDGKANVVAGKFLQVRCQDCVCGTGCYAVDAVGRASAIAAWNLRDHVEAMLAEVRAEVERHKWNHQQANELTVSVQEKWEAEIADRDRTIAEQAAELEALKERLSRSMLIAGNPPHKPSSGSLSAPKHWPHNGGSNAK